MPARSLKLGLIACLPVALAIGCADDTTESPAPRVGADESARTKVLDAGAAAIQDRPPVEAINAYLDGFHFYNGRPDEQMEAHHYCSVLNEDITQCVIFDGNVGDARIMGVEYIISARLFAGLPDAEKAMWHSHVYEVKSGQLIAPGLPEVAEHELMEKLVHTYGKTWHTWHTDLDKALPSGVPQLMMGFTADGQADPEMIAARDKRFELDSAQNKARRADIEAPAIDPGADAWQHGNTVQIEDPSGAHEAPTANKEAPPPDSQSNARSTKP